MQRQVTILALETSCDETGVALVRAVQSGGNYCFDVQEDLLHSQVRLHRRTGGVVPEVAAREHAVRLPRLLQVLITRRTHAALRRQVDAIAVTNGPGLITSLLVGVEAARLIAYAWRKPLVPVNHLEGHVYANLLKADSRSQKSKVKSQKFNSKSKIYRSPAFQFPLLALIVSGGHTELILMRHHLNYQLVGATRDDAAGECFDKCARLLGLPYPGGPELARLALRGRPDAVPLPRPMLKDQTLEMSFAGLKTAVAVYLEQHPRISRPDLAASIEAAIVDTLVAKTLRAVTRLEPRTVVLAGGVAANLHLRKTLEAELKQRFSDIIFIQPALKYATDNAAMIAAAGAIRFLNGRATKWDKVRVDPQLPLK